MKKNLTLAVVAALGLGAALTSCKKGCTDETALNYDEKAKKENPDVPCIYPEEDDFVTVSSNITSNTTWTKDNVYHLESRVVVESGATLTIEAGTIIKGGSGTGANAKALIVARGGMINAVGTATEPIIFTSVADEIMPGQIASPNLSDELQGLWGGVIILGNANISADVSPKQIEGIPASDPNGLYGGSDDADNSGTLQYVSIRHGGTNIGEGNEINGLTLGGVGSGTTIDHIEIVANNDDGVEFFGGTVSVSDLVVMNNGDDALDTDQAWNGTVDNFAIYNPGDEAMELDGPEGTYVNGNFTIQNGSCYMDNPSGVDPSGLVDNDDNTNVNMNNVYFFKLKSGQDFDQVPTVYTPVIASLEADIPSGDALTDYFKDGSDAFTTDVAGGTPTVGVTKSEFNTWSWAAVAGIMDEF